LKTRVCQEAAHHGHWGRYSGPIGTLPMYCSCRQRLPRQDVDMPRMAGIAIPNLPHRVTQRGNMGSIPRFGVEWRCAV
jgi:hypothetical protein